MASSTASSLSDRDRARIDHMAFRRAHCLAAIDQLTPPSSPHAPRQKISRQRPKLQLFKLLGRPKRPKISHTEHSVDLRNPPFQSTIQDSFPQTLPDSPTETRTSSVSTVSRVEPPDLRRVSMRYHDLKHLAVQQSVLKASLPATPLLPSPITHELLEQDEAFFKFHNPRLTRDDGDYKSYEDLHILSYYCDDSKTETIQDIERELEESLSGDFSSSHGDDSTSTVSDDPPETPKDKITRATLCSDESGWLANSTTPIERKRRFKARCYQVVQHPLDSEEEQKDEDRVLLATVLVGPGKPKLVQISRAGSLSSPRNSHAEPPDAQPHTPKQYPREISAFSPYDTPGDTLDERMNFTPVPYQTPVSSPWPSYSSASLVPPQLSLLRSQSYQSSCSLFSKTQQHLDDLTDPFGSVIARQSRSLANQDEALTALPHSNEDDSQISSTLSLPSSPTPSDSQTPKPGSGDHPERWRDLSRMLPCLEEAITTFAFHSSYSSSSALTALNLSSSLTRDIRCPHVPDAQYITTLTKIFPSNENYSKTWDSLLSALAAWIIVDLELCQRIAELQSTTPIQAQHQEYVPSNAGRQSKAAARLSRLPNFQLFPPSPSHHPKCPCCVTSPTTQPAAPVQKGHRPQYSFTTLVNKSNSSLHRIPARARNLLGITHSPSTPTFPVATNTRFPSLRTLSATQRKPITNPVVHNQQAHTETKAEQQHPGHPCLTDLLHKSVGTQASVAVIGRNLVAALRGTSGFDEDIWRSLRVLIEVVEEGGWAQHTGRERSRGRSSGSDGESRSGIEIEVADRGKSESWV